MNIGAPWPDLDEAERRVLVMQTKLHRLLSAAECRARAGVLVPFIAAAEKARDAAIATVEQAARPHTPPRAQRQRRLGAPTDSLCDKRARFAANGNAGDAARPTGVIRMVSRGPSRSAPRMSGRRSSGRGGRARAGRVAELVRWRRARVRAVSGSASPISAVGEGKVGLLWPGRLDVQ